MTLAGAPGKRGPGSWPAGNMSAKRGTSLGKIAPSKRAAERVSLRKKNGPGDDNGRVAPSPVPVQVVPGAVVAPLRRSYVSTNFSAHNTYVQLHAQAFDKI